MKAEANSEATNFIRSWKRKQKIFHCFHIPDFDKFLLKQVNKEISDITMCINEGAGTLVMLEQLEIKLGEAENMQISAPQLQEAFNAVSTLKGHSATVSFKVYRFLQVKITFSTQIFH